MPIGSMYLSTQVSAGNAVPTVSPARREPGISNTIHELREALPGLCSNLAPVIPGLRRGSGFFVRAHGCADSSACLARRSFPEPLERGFRRCRHLVFGSGSGPKPDSHSRSARTYRAIGGGFGDCLPRLDMCVWHEQRGIEAILWGSNPC